MNQTVQAVQNMDTDTFLAFRQELIKKFNVKLDVNGNIIKSHPTFGCFSRKEVVSVLAVIEEAMPKETIDY